jgi:uncharacterized protein (DUF4213/DUF364 family)
MRTAQASIAARISATARERAGAIEVADLRIGLGYTAALLEDGRLGLAYTFRREAEGGCTVDLESRPLAGRRVSDLVPFTMSDNPIDAAVGLACANALTNIRGEGQSEGDILDHLDLGPRDDVGMVGLFGPLVHRLRQRARSLTIFERVSHREEGVRPAAEAIEILPRCSVALITSTTILNHTIERLLGVARGCRVVALLGASTPLVPEVFTGTAITLLSGVVAREPGLILRVVSEGGGMRMFKRHVRKVVLPVG